MRYANLDDLRRHLSPDVQLVTDGSHATPQSTHKLSEYELTRLVFDECDRRALTDPRWGCIYANVNGQYRKGQRPEPGLKRGVPDIFVAVPVGQYAGMYCELKISPNKPSRDQLEWFQRLRQRGYKVAVLWDSVDAVIDAIDAYLEESS